VEESLPAGPSPFSFGGLRTSAIFESMGYVVSITRAKTWEESEETPIAFEDWAALVESDPDLRFRVPEPVDGRLPRNKESWVAWSGHPDIPEVWFDLWKGNIDTKNPDELILQKMWQMAQALFGRVQGESGEFYDSRGVPIEESLS